MYKQLEAHLSLIHSPDYSYGDSALHIAIRGRSKKVTELLLRNPRNSRLLYRPNKDGETPYQIDAYHPKGILSQIYGHSK
jgi:ankyrin repeat-rich membrane spanning protein